MPSQNDVTGDMIQSKQTSKQYRDNWDKIFGKKEKNMKTEKSKEERKGV